MGVGAFAPARDLPHSRACRAFSATEAFQRPFLDHHPHEPTRHELLVRYPLRGVMIRIAGNDTDVVTRVTCP
jgi:hypothetical protein